jgi:hypothetical protein
MVENNGFISNYQFDFRDSLSTIEHIALYKGNMKPLKTSNIVLQHS